ncbi:MAG: response regulator [Cyanobacteria bacterium P01_D01_bin.73]
MKMSDCDRETGRVLIVDDNPTNLGILSDVLDWAGLDVSVANSGQKALDRVRLIHPDLILLDVMMPDIDGFETCARLKADSSTRDIPIIFMTALSDVADKVKGLELGAVDYITKPFQQGEVLARAQTHLRLYRLQRQVTRQNAELEERVQQRTQELEKALEALKSTHLQLVQTEKMSSLGQLVAGIAHEINNPVNFIYGNLSHAERYMKQVLEAISTYRPLAHQALGSDSVSGLDEEELEFVEEDFPQLLQSMLSGTQRIRGIVKGLQTFSRTDEAPCKVADLHENIDSTLTILQSRLKGAGNSPAIEMVKNYGDLPQVECYSGELNQVFMNLIGNGIDAIHQRYQEQQERQEEVVPGRIEIMTQVESNGQVCIAIADNGCGMSDATRHKMFEPFFTTKPVGKGKGLGLSLSYSIITQKHRGKLTCDSQVGQGARFEVRIPLEGLGRASGEEASVTWADWTTAKTSLDQQC